MKSTAAGSERYHNNFREAGVAALKGRRRDREPFLAQKEIEEEAKRPKGEPPALPGGFITYWQMLSSDAGFDDNEVAGERWLDPPRGLRWGRLSIGKR